jgi:hypothetical protein
MTQHQRLSMHMQAIRKKIVDLTGYTHDEINTMFFEGAYSFLKLIGCNDETSTLMASTPQFWNYWQKQWCEIDEMFILKYIELQPSPECLQIGIIQDPENHVHYRVDNAKDLRKWYQMYHECKLSNRCLNSTLIYNAYKLKSLKVKQ